jgi:hypothetical protein
VDERSEPRPPLLPEMRRIACRRVQPPDGRRRGRRFCAGSNKRARFLDRHRRGRRSDGIHRPHRPGDRDADRLLPSDRRGTRYPGRACVGRHGRYRTHSRTGQIDGKQQRFPQPQTDAPSCRRTARRVARPRSRETWRSTRSSRDHRRRGFRQRPAGQESNLRPVDRRPEISARVRDQG